MKDCVITYMNNSIQENNKGIAACDYCNGGILPGEKIKLCGDGAIVHMDCVIDYAVEQLTPIMMKIEEAIGKPA
ncbi:MAG: hypothetical protein K0R93_698 [Anaerosolibacter sp.]|uniref:hypothetical protein n=1 Tax=Anaerosolibacter sp. TaxID=1872527 RepID=UPI002601D838|nr:hypothetical protein [Anaerosolibacter sp.]MDF2545800.1 hypothetical protein [Anaerosolibacter sp.]